MEDKNPVAINVNESWGVKEMVWDPTSSFLAFTRTDDPKKIFLININTNVITEVASFDLSINTLKWGAKGNIFTFCAMVYPGMSMSETAEFDKDKSENYHSTAIAFDNPPVYRWDSFFTV